MGKPGIREENNKITKERILKSALQLFRENGYYNVTVDEIVEHASSSKGALYNHFGSKDGLIISYMEGWDSYYDKYYQDVLLSPDYRGTNALDKICDMFLFILGVLTADGDEIARVASTYLLRDDKARTLNIDPKRKYLEIFRSLIREGKEEGSIRPSLPDQMILRCLDILVRGAITDWGIHHGAYDIKESGNMLIRPYCHSLSPD